MQGVTAGRHIAAVSWRVLSRDPQLRRIPVIAITTFAVVVIPGLVVLGGSDGAQTSEVRFWVVLVAGSAFAGCAVAFAAPLAAGRNGAGRVLGWAALATVADLARRRSEERFGTFGRVLSRIGGTTFSAVSFVALPVVAFRDLGPIDRLTRSASLVSSPAGPGRVGLGVALAVVPVVAGLVATGALAIEVVVVVLAGIWTAVVLAVTSVLTGAASRRRRG